MQNQNETHLPRLAATVASLVQSESPVAVTSLEQRLVHLTQQLQEVRQLNRRLEMLNAELLAEKGSLRYRIVDEIYGVLKRRPMLQKLRRLVLPLSMRGVWYLRNRAAKKVA